MVFREGSRSFPDQYGRAPTLVLLCRFASSFLLEPGSGGLPHFYARNWSEGVHWPCASSLFAVGKPHRPRDAKLTGGGKLAASDRLFRVPALNRDKGLEIDANIKLQISQIFRSALICLCFAQLGSTYRSQQVFRVNRLCQQFEIMPGVFGQIYDFSCCCLP